MEKFFGFMLFLTMALCGFWLLKFLVLFLPAWLTGQVGERFDKLNKGKRADHYQKPLEVLYKKEN
ncbi:MAG: hypothetical protein ACK5HU_00940 [Flavobacteriales bacterium]